jgi:hypothetical protein
MQQGLSQAPCAEQAQAGTHKAASFRLEPKWLRCQQHQREAKNQKHGVSRWSEWSPDSDSAGKALQTSLTGRLASEFKL